MSVFWAFVYVKVIANSALSFQMNYKNRDISVSWLQLSVKMHHWRLFLG